jgi:hypothetical protein
MKPVVKCFQREFDVYFDSTNVWQLLNEIRSLISHKVDILEDMF